MLQQPLLHGKSLEDAGDQAREIAKMTENIAAVNLIRQWHNQKGGLLKDAAD